MEVEEVGAPNGFDLVGDFEPSVGVEVDAPNGLGLGGDEDPLDGAAGFPNANDVVAEPDVAGVED